MSSTTDSGGTLHVLVPKSLTLAAENAKLRELLEYAVGRWGTEDMTFVHTAKWTFDARMALGDKGKSK